MPSVARHLVRPADAVPGAARVKRARAPHREGAGPVERVRDAAAGDRVGQTAAGSSSTRRLRVRFESSGMPGPIVVVMAAFLM